MGNEFKTKVGRDLYVREDKLHIDHLLCLEATIPFERWHEPVLQLRKNLIEIDVYFSNRIIFCAEEVSGRPGIYKFSIFIEILNHHEFNPNEFTSIQLNQALSVRMTEEDWNDGYQALDEYAKDNDFTLIKPYYHVCVDVFGDVVTDILAPIEAI